MLGASEVSRTVLSYMSPGPGTGLQGPALLQIEMKMLLDTSSLAETLTVVTVFISLAAICVNLVRKTLNSETLGMICVAVKRLSDFLCEVLIGK